MDECDRRKQQDNESAEDYLMAMSKLAHDIGESDDYIYMAAMRGINRKYKEQVIYQRPTTFSELLVAAKFVEGIHRSIHDEMPKHKDSEMAGHSYKMSLDLKSHRRNRSRPYSRGNCRGASTLPDVTTANVVDGATTIINVLPGARNVTHAVLWDTSPTCVEAPGSTDPSVGQTNQRLELSGLQETRGTSLSISIGAGNKKKEEEISTVK